MGVTRPTGTPQTALTSSTTQPAPPVARPEPTPTTCSAAYRAAPVAHGIPLDMAVVTNALDHLRRMQVVAPSQRRDRRVSDAELDQIEGWWRGMQRWDETTRGGRWWA